MTIGVSRKVPYASVMAVILVALATGGAGTWLSCGGTDSGRAAQDAGLGRPVGTWRLVIAGGALASTTTLAIAEGGTFTQTVQLQTGRTINGSGTWSATDATLTIQFTTCVEVTDGGEQPSTSCRSETKGYEVSGASLKVWDPRVGPNGSQTFTRV